MSHETTASIWSVLNKCQDLGLYIREATGQHILGNYCQQDGTSTSSNTVLTYAIELTTIFEFIQASNDAQPLCMRDSRTISWKESTCQALVHLIHTMLPLLGEENRQATRIHLHILTRSMLTALCALYSHVHVMRPTQTASLTKAIQILTTHCSKFGPDSEFLLLLNSSLLNHLHRDHLQEESKHDSYSWKEIYHSDSETKSEMIENLVDAATKFDVHPSVRLQAIVKLSSAYLESEAVLIRNCTRYEEIQTTGAITDSGPHTVDTAMIVRSLIQDSLINAALDDSTKLWAQYVSAHVLFAVGRYSACILDTCQCTFRRPRRRKSRILQSRLQQSYCLSSFKDCETECTNNVLENFNDRLASQSVRCEQLDVPADRTFTVSKITPHINSPSQGSTSPKTVDQPPGLSPSNSERVRTSQNQLSQHHLQRITLPDRSRSYSTVDENLESVFDRNDARSPPALSESGQFSPGQQSRTSSSTTMTSSLRDEGQLTLRIPQSRQTLQTRLEEGYKIAVDTPGPLVIASSVSPDGNFPEVVNFHRTGSDRASLFSHESVPTTIFSTQEIPRRGKWSNLLRGRRETLSKYTVPKFRFFSSGKHILLWTQYGGAIVDPSQTNAPEVIPIRVPEILYAAGGTARFVLITRLGERYQVSVHHYGNSERITEWELKKPPGAIDLSRSDHYLAVKYTRTLLLYDLRTSNPPIQHRLQSYGTSRPDSDNHLVKFATDSQSFMAATRFQPERVYIYWSQCEQSQTSVPIETFCTAPSGDVADHGLTSLTVCSPTMWSYAGGFLTTFTEKGYPAILNMHPKEPSSRLLRECKEQIGTRIHGAAMSMDPESRKSNLVLVNQNNAVFWITDLLGNYTETAQVNTLKRAKSLKDEIQVAMSEHNEASIFWVDRANRRGVLVKVGKGGGKTNPVYFRLDIDPLCGV